MTIAARLLRLVAVATGTVAGASGAAYGLLNEQSRRARKTIGIPLSPLRADGIYLPSSGGGNEPGDEARGPQSPGTAVRVSPLEFAFLGDSSAAGIGVDVVDELPGVRIARGLADELERPVSLSTHAIVGSTTRGLAFQVDAILDDPDNPPRLVLIFIGANDVTSRVPISESTQLLGRAVTRLTDAGVAVVVGTCPDLGTVRPIPQPLRWVARSWSLALSKAQRRIVEAAGGHAVPLADLLAPEFLTRPVELFSRDRFHPSAAGYRAATELLLPTLCDAIGEWAGGPVPSAPIRSATVEARRPTSRIVARLNLRLGRRADS